MLVDLFIGPPPDRRLREFGFRGGIVFCVPRRIGGLESRGVRHEREGFVPRRIGGLEKHTKDSH